MKGLYALMAAVTAAAQDSPVPATEAWLTGTVEAGYRWRTGVGGSLDSYRSVVDLGSGPKLLGADFTVLDPGKRLFDRVEVRAQNWGDDPYSTAHVRARKEGMYEFSGDYRNLAYFNALPSFANPQLGRGVFVSQRSFDLRRRLAVLQLDLRPGSRITPYLVYERSSGCGRGVTTFVGAVNEYPVPDRIRDSNETYRGGVRFEFGRFHATGEAGGTVFKDDQEVFAPGSMNAGNREAPYLGERLSLTDLQQAYGVRGRGMFTKVLFAANARAWLDLYGQFLYSRPDTRAQYRQFNSGNFAEAGGALFVTTEQFALASQARMPHTSGAAGAEIRPWQGGRVLLSWLTDRLENTGTALFATLLRNDYSQADVDLIVDGGRKVTLRGGYRYVWGEGQNSVLPAAGLPGPDRARLRRQVGKGGVTFRPASRISVSTDAEVAGTDRFYFRTSLKDYQRVRVRGRYQAAATLSLAVDFAFLNNHTEAAGADYALRSRSGSLALFWSPRRASRVQVQGSYSRGTFRSDNSYIAGPFFERERSLYRDNAHTADGRVDLTLPAYAGMAPRLSLGGTFFWSSGSRPTRHYQPLASCSVPVTKAVSWTAEWRYQGFGEAFYGFEAFRTHLITTGIRVTR